MSVYLILFYNFMTEPFKVTNSFIMTMDYFKLKFKFVCFNTSLPTRFLFSFYDVLRKPVKVMDNLVITRDALSIFFTCTCLKTIEARTLYTCVQ